jgi:hypothetical protein
MTNDEKSAQRPRHKRPTAEQLDERVAIPLNPQTVIDGMMQVDAEKVKATEGKRQRKRT